MLTRKILSVAGAALTQTGDIFNVFTPTPWVRYAGNPVMEPGAGTWDDFRVENMVMAKDDLAGATIRMWYSGAPTIDGEDNSAIGYATCAQ